MTDAAHDAAPAAPAIFSIPLFGPLLALIADPEWTPVFAVLGVLVLGIALVAIFGYPALILLGLAGAWGSLAMLMVLTRAR